MIDKKEMLVKVASYDKTACVLANAVIRFKEAMQKQSAYLAEQDKAVKTAAVKYIVDGVLNKKSPEDKKASVLDLVNKVISK